MNNYLFEAVRILSPKAEFSIDDDDLNTMVWYNDSIPRPSDDAIRAEAQKLKDQQPITECKNKAKELLTETDWTEIPSVTNPDITPRLLNSSEFVSYRAALRELAVRPVVNPVFPVAPQEQWSS